VPADAAALVVRLQLDAAEDDLGPGVVEDQRTGVLAVDGDDLRARRVEVRLVVLIRPKVGRPPSGT